MPPSTYFNPTALPFLSERYLFRKDMEETFYRPDAVFCGLSIHYKHSLFTSWVDFV